MRNSIMRCFNALLVLYWPAHICDTIHMMGAVRDGILREEEVLTDRFRDTVVKSLTILKSVYYLVRLL